MLNMLLSHQNVKNTPSCDFLFSRIKAMVFSDIIPTTGPLLSNLTDLFAR